MHSLARVYMSPFGIMSHRQNLSAEIYTLLKDLTNCSKASNYLWQLLFHVGGLGLHQKLNSSRTQPPQLFGSLSTSLLPTTLIAKRISVYEQQITASSTLCVSAYINLLQSPGDKTGKQLLKFKAACGTTQSGCVLHPSPS